ncbi:MAG: ATPase inhibitor subunit zeta [Acetobacteraceae bacterium]
MSDLFQEREQSYEAKFAHDEALRFRIRARRDKLFARWAAGVLGLSDAQTEAVISDVLAIKDGPNHDQALKDHLRHMLRDHPQGSEASVSAAMDRCMTEARAQLGGAVP